MANPVVSRAFVAVIGWAAGGAAATGVGAVAVARQAYPADRQATLEISDGRGVLPARGLAADESARENAVPDGVLPCSTGARTALRSSP